MGRPAEHQRRPRRARAAPEPRSPGRARGRGPRPGRQHPAYVPRVLPAELPGVDDELQLHVRHVDPPEHRQVPHRQSVRSRSLVGCAACHTPYNYAGNREPQRLRNDDGTFTEVDDPTTKHREFDPAKDIGPVDVNGTIQQRIIGRPVGRDEVFNSFGVARGAFDLDGDGQKDGEQQKTYSRKHETTTKIDTDTCGLCHGFVTRINYAYQGAAEDEQRDPLARRGPIEFTTPNGTEVRILDSWVREDNDINNDGVKDAVPTIVRPEGVAVVEKARERDAKLLTEGCKPGQRFPDCGLGAGAGGCAQNTFSEDCNNNGELDQNLLLERRDLDGNVIASTTIDEDANNNGKLDLIDRIPRENAIDGRQVRYIYGGRNGSTKQMDVHFERGMHCIDCHFMQDVHGDGKRLLDELGRHRDRVRGLPRRERAHELQDLGPRTAATTCAYRRTRTSSRTSRRSTAR